MSSCLNIVPPESCQDFWKFLIQVGIRPDRRARGMLHSSGGGSEWGVGESGRGGSHVPPPWGNVGRENVKNGGILGAGGPPRHPRRHSWRGMLIFDVFLEHFRRHWETLWQPWGSRGTPVSPFFGPGGAILQPQGGIRDTTRKRRAFWSLRGVKK